VGRGVHPAEVAGAAEEEAMSHYVKPPPLGPIRVMPVTFFCWWLEYWDWEPPKEKR